MSTGDLSIYCENLRGKSGMEIGGPSEIFEKNNILPIYQIINKLDICNIHKIDDRINIVCDAVNLDQIASKKYDFVLSAHTIEHIANPLKALYEWKRILKDDGVLLLIVPHKGGTVDHNRQPTEISHLIDDHQRNVGEDDKTHLNEVLKLVDLKIDPSYLDLDGLKKWTDNNYAGRYVHLHVFDTQLVVQIFDLLGLQILSVDVKFPYHIIIMGKKVKSGSIDNREYFLDKTIKKRPF
jgi:SAM-dependent methyltransferase